MLFRDERESCQHGKRLTESRGAGMVQVWCMGCPHTWIEMPLNVRPRDTTTFDRDTPTGPMTVYCEET